MCVCVRVCVTRDERERGVRERGAEGVCGCTIACVRCVCGRGGAARALEGAERWARERDASGSRGADRTRGEHTNDPMVCMCADDRYSIQLPAAGVALRGSWRLGAVPARCVLFNACFTSIIFLLLFCPL